MNAKKVIIDCDPGIDDALALMLALSSPEMQVLGITTVSGNTNAAKGAENALKVLKWMNRLDIPVYIGADRPLVRDYVNAEDTHGEDGFGQSGYPNVTEVRPREDALSFLRDTLLRSDSVSVIALGPMTNLAQLAQTAPEAFARIDELVSMGGSYKSHGNCSPVAEYNYWCDPDAAKIVYEAYEQMVAKENTSAVGATSQENTTAAGATASSENTAAESVGAYLIAKQAAKAGQRAPKLIHMIGLDVTRKIVLTPTLLQYMRYVNPEIGGHIADIVQFYFDFHWKQEGIIGCVINDPLAVAYFIDRSLCSGFASYTTVETQGISIGQTLVDAYHFWNKPSNSYILTKTDAAAMMKLFMVRVLHANEEEAERIYEQQ